MFQRLVAAAKLLPSCALYRRQAAETDTLWHNTSSTKKDLIFCDSINSLISQFYGSLFLFFILPKLWQHSTHNSNFLMQVSAMFWWHQNLIENTGIRAKSLKSLISFMLKIFEAYHFHLSCLVVCALFQQFCCHYSSLGWLAAYTNGRAEVQHETLL